MYVANGFHNHGELGIFLKMTHFIKTTCRFTYLQRQNISLPANSPHSWEKTHVSDNAYKQNSWSNCAVDINVCECVYVYVHVCLCIHVCVCVCVCVCVRYLISSWQTYCRIWMSVKLVFWSTLRHKLERANYLCTVKRVLLTKEHWDMLLKSQVMYCWCCWICGYLW